MMTHVALSRIVKAPLGFTLVEMAVVLVIIGLLLGGLLVPLNAQLDLRNNAETQKAMSEIQEALIGYALSHTATDGKPYLPCPDTDGNGDENRTGSACTNVEGNLPSQSLGLLATDAWDNHYRYRVTQSFADNATGFTLNSTGDITVLDASGGNIIASSIPAIVLSSGKNGVVAAVGNDEIENSNSDNIFDSHSQSNSVTDPFDDLLVWVSAPVLLNRMVSAQKLP